MEQDVTKKDKSLLFKIVSIIFVLGYIVFFIYQFINTDFNFENNLYKIVLLFILLLLFCCCLVTKNIISIMLGICSWIIILFLIFPNIQKLIPNPIKDSTKTNRNKITCNGSTDTSDKTIIDIDYTNDKIIKIIYTYTFDIEKKDGVQNLVNRFDKMYSDFASIYSEIEISDNVIVKITYKLDNVDIDKIKEIEETFTNSYKEFKKKNLNNFTCKNRD